MNPFVTTAGLRWVQVRALVDDLPGPLNGFLPFRGPGTGGVSLRCEAWTAGR